MRGHDAGVLSALSDVSASDDSDDERRHVMDPSDPRAHRPAPSVAHVRSPRLASTPIADRHSDSDSDTENTGTTRLGAGARVSAPPTQATRSNAIDTEDVIPIQFDDEDEDDDGDSRVTAMKQNQKETKTSGTKTVTLSKWAQARFLVPAGARKVAVVEDTSLEPLNDFILSDFSSRYRGDVGNVDVEKASTTADDEDKDEDESLVGLNRPKHVGAPLFETSRDGRSVEAGNRRERDTGSNQKVQKKKEGDGRKRKESRYFVTDLATKCFHCGKVGHMASVCMNDKLQPPCYYCALRGHQSWACPNLPCANCLQLGHQEKYCTNRAMTTKTCKLCGCTGHTEDHCGNVDTVEQATCMVCTRVGHLHCVPVPPPADRRVYCPNCAENHKLERCRRYSKPIPVNLTARVASGRFVQTCFVCSEAGHIAAECPTRSNGYGRGRDGCYKCGRSGHFAAECYSSSHHHSNDRHDSSRKRYREVEDEYPNYRGHRRR